MKLHTIYQTHSQNIQWTYNLLRDDYVSTEQNLPLNWNPLQNFIEGGFLHLFYMKIGNKFDP